MPWVLCDWTSSSLNLADPAVYRDLSLPVGALNPARRPALKQRFEEARHAQTGAGVGCFSFSLLTFRVFIFLFFKSLLFVFRCVFVFDVCNAFSSAPFHHGSHYSNAGVVLFWLLRQEPFTSLHLELQGGRFDHPERLFSSLPDAWNGVWNNPQVVVLLSLS
jgi:hypothetical protein